MIHAADGESRLVNGSKHQLVPCRIPWSIYLCSVGGEVVGPTNCALPNLGAAAGKTSLPATPSDGLPPRLRFLDGVPPIPEVQLNFAPQPKIPTLSRDFTIS
jgi:hypothetical protein